MTAGEIWDRDANKHKQILQSNSITTLDIVWESDFRKLDDELVLIYYNKIKEIYENQTNN